MDPTALRFITTTRLPQPRKKLNNKNQHLFSFKKFISATIFTSSVLNAASIKQSGLFDSETDHVRVLKLG